MIKEMINSKNEALRTSLRIIEEKLENGVTESDEKEIKEAFKDMKEKDPGVFQQIYDMLFKASISGAAGRMMFEWIMSFSKFN